VQDVEQPSADLQSAGEKLAYQPLYKRVKSLLVSRIADGRWQPGQIIPNEFQIADELDVSQGTVRKALHEMTADNLLVRRQGRGTFVTSYDDERILFQFFKLNSDQGIREFPDSTVVSLERAAAESEEAGMLGIKPGEAVWRLARRRTLGEKPIIIERLVLPVSIFPDLDALETIPNNLYGLYSNRYGVTVARAVEKLKAVAASAADAKQLDCPFGLPLLQVDRCAVGLDGRVVEWRLSRCITESHHYLSDLK
jgi:GntR family transcriptional regulator